MTSGARETGKATVRDSASAAGEWLNTEHKSAAETPNPNALFPADSIHPSLPPHFFAFTFFSSHVHAGNHNLLGNKTFQVGVPSFSGIAALTSKFRQRFFIFVFLKFVKEVLDRCWWWPLSCVWCAFWRLGCGTRLNLCGLWLWFAPRSSEHACTYLSFTKINSFLFLFYYKIPRRQDISVLYKVLESSSLLWLRCLKNMKKKELVLLRSIYCFIFVRFI